MAHTLTLEVPEDVYEPLAQTARQTGRSPEEVAAQWLVTAIRTAIDDPVEKFIGALQTNISGWADQHDKYIGQGLMEQMHKAE